MARTPAKSPASSRFVLDCSIVLSWYFADESDPYADSVARALPGRTVVVPSLFHLEVANALVVGERRKRGTEALAAAFLARLSGLPITIDGQTPHRAWTETIALARAHDLSSYDAACLELAARESIPLATRDEKLKDAAKAIGVARFKP